MVLTINNISATIQQKQILNDLSLTIEPGKVHVIMGPNGTGKSTLTKILAGYPDYIVTKGTIHFKEHNLLALSPEERVHSGLFVGFQNPIDVPGVSNVQFLHTAYNAKRKALGQNSIAEHDFLQLAHEKCALLSIPTEILSRDVNSGFSGGEKKRNEILQMAILEPIVAVLDEADSGLDIDAMKIVATSISTIMDGQKSVVLITHYQRLLRFITPDSIHILMHGQIVHSGGPDLASYIETHGYDWVPRPVQ